MGLLLLFTGSGSGPQSIGLPFSDGAESFGPTVVGEGSVNLPHNDGGESFGPDVFVDQSVALPHTDGGESFAPDVAVTGSVDLPFSDGGESFAPTVVVEQTIGLPFSDGGESFAPTIFRDQTLDLPWSDGGWSFGPNVLTEADIAAADQDGVIVRSYARDGTLLAELDLAHGKQWTDQVDDTGSGSITVQNDDPDYAHTGFDRILRYFAGGQPRFASLVENRDVNSLATSGAEEVTRLFGRGALALTDEWSIGPSRGVGSLPIEVERSSGWMTSDFDHSGWGNAKQIARQDHQARYWRSLPIGWPDPLAWWVWADRDDCTTEIAPAGKCLFVDWFTVADVTRIAFIGTPDNAGSYFFDGAKMFDSDGWFSEAQRVDLTISPGEHMVAIRGINNPDDWPPGGNPGGVLGTIFSVTGEGFLDQVLWRSTSAMKCLPYPDREPGPTVGRFLRLHLEEAQAAGACQGITLGCTDDLDANGNPWDIESEITVSVGRSFLDVVQELAGSVADIAMAPGGLQLRAWRYGERGNTSPVELEVGNLAGLTHSGKRTTVNAVLVRWSGGWLVEEDTVSIAANDRRQVFLDLTTIQSEEKARELARETMSNRSSPRYAVTAAIDPNTGEAASLHALEPGDTITHLNESLTPEAGRIRAVTVEETEHGRVDRTVRINDLAEELESRFDRWLRRWAPGALAGGSRIVSPGGDPAPSARTISPRAASEISMEGTVTTSTVIRLLLNGDYIGDPVTFTTGDDQKIGLDAQVVMAEADFFQIEVDGVRSQRQPFEVSGNLVDALITRTAVADGTAGAVVKARVI